MVDKQEKDIEKTLKSSRGKRLLEALGEKKAKKILQDKEALELLLYPRFCVWHGVSDKEIIDEKFEQEVIKGFELLKPFNEVIFGAF